MILMDHLPRT